MELDQLMDTYTKERKGAPDAQGSGQQQGAEATAGTDTLAGVEPESEPAQPDAVAEPQATAGDATTEQAGDATATAGNSNAQEHNQPAESTTAPVELSDEQVLQYLKDKKGVEVSSLDEISPAKPLTPEQQEHEAKVKRDKAITFGLTEGLFDTDALEQYNVDKARTPEEIVYEHFAALQHQEEAGISDEDIRERFEEEYGINQEEDNWRRKAGLQRMELFKEQYLNHKYGDVVNAEQHYDSFVQQETNMKNYAKAVDQVFTGFDKEYKFSLTDKNNEGQESKTYAYTFPYNVEEMEAIKKQFLTEDVLKKAAKGEVDAVALKQSVDVAVKTHFMGQIIKNMAFAYASDKLIETQMERQGVKPVNEVGTSQNQSARQSQNLQPAVDFIKQATGRTINVN